jgi:hypothetical protein
LEWPDFAIATGVSFLKFGRVPLGRKQVVSGAGGISMLA